MTQQDLDVRLQLIGQKYSGLANIFANDLKWGRKNAKHEWKELILLDVYISILENYDINSSSNCFTEDELLLIFDKISKLTKICFKPLGFTYSSAEEIGQFDDSFDDSFL